MEKVECFSTTPFSDNLEKLEHYREFPNRKKSSDYRDFP
nr:MAG TPA: hypothetical protein [Caudoviricetes sp.]